MTSIRTLTRVAALLIALLAVTVTVAGWMLVSNLDRMGSVSSPDTFETLHRTLDVTVETMAILEDSMSDLDRLVGSVAESSATTAAFVDDTAAITSGRIATSLEAIERAMPGLIEAGAVVEDTLSTLSLFGVDYRPATPFDDALREIGSSLDGLSADVAAQGDTLRGLVPEVEEVGENSARLAERIRHTRSQLARAGSLIDDYRVILTDAERSFGSGSQPSRLDVVARVLLLVAGASGVGLAVTLWRLAPGLDAARSAELVTTDR